MADEGAGSTGTDVEQVRERENKRRAPCLVDSLVRERDHSVKEKKL
jgi:hypothetical protein